MNVRLIADPDKAIKAISKPTMKQCEIVNEDLVMVRAARRQVTLNKPIYTGFAILELSKVLMYEFHYDYMMARYANNATLLFTDTDSLTYHVRTEDLFADMAVDRDRFDTSNFEPSHPLYSRHNARVVGKFKSETGSKAPKEFVGLRPKLYSLYVNKDAHPKHAVKGVKKSFVAKHVRHNDFLNVLQSRVPGSATFRQFRSTNHVLETVEMTKTSLSAYDDKRYILSDGVSSLAYGHKDIPH